MEDVTSALKAARVMNGMSARDVARLVGVSPSTVTRVENGASRSASFDLITKVLRANDLGPDLRPISRPSAITAARYVLGDSVEPPDDLDEWVDRWRTLRLITTDSRVLDARGLALSAGRSANLATRPQAINVERSVTWMEAGRCLNDAAIEWANTGDSAANRLSEYADQIWPVFYVSDQRSAVDAISAPIRLPGEYGPRITLIPFDGASEVGRWSDSTGYTEGMWFAAPWQVVMDSYGGLDRMPLQADRILDNWGAA